MIGFWHFYGTSIGKVLRRLVREKIGLLWPDLSGRTVLVIGYGTPYLKLFLDNAQRTLHFTPLYTEPVYWPLDGKNITAIIDETALPLPDVSVDRVLIIHGLEHAPVPAALLQEVWRVLTAQGRVLTIVPNRLGFWAQAERTPFGSGQPFTEGQLRQILKDNGFMVHRSDCALFLPPSWTRVALNIARWIEKIGQRWFPAFAGVIMLEAGKHVYAVNPIKQKYLSRFISWPILETKPSLRQNNFRHDRP